MHTYAPISSTHQLSHVAPQLQPRSSTSPPRKSGSRLRLRWTEWCRMLNKRFFLEDEIMAKLGSYLYFSFFYPWSKMITQMEVTFKHPLKKVTTKTQKKGHWEEPVISFKPLGSFGALHWLCGQIESFLPRMGFSRQLKKSQAKEAEVSKYKWHKWHQHHIKSLDHPRNYHQRSTAIQHDLASYQI